MLTKVLRIMGRDAAKLVIGFTKDLLLTVGLFAAIFAFGGVMYLTASLMGVPFEWAMGPLVAVAVAWEWIDRALERARKED